MFTSPKDVSALTVPKDPIDVELVMRSLRELRDEKSSAIKTHSFGLTWLRLRLTPAGVEATGTRSIRIVDGPTRQLRMRITYPGAAMDSSRVLAELIAEDFAAVAFEAFAVRNPPRD